MWLWCNLLVKKLVIDIKDLSVDFVYAVLRVTAGVSLFMCKSDHRKHFYNYKI